VAADPLFCFYWSGLMASRALVAVVALVLGCSDGGTLILRDVGASDAPVGDDAAMSASGGTSGEAGASANSGEAGETSADASDGGQCRTVTTALPSPHSVQFLFLNTSGRDLFLSLKCELNFMVRSCADGYAAALVTQYPPGSAPCSADTPCSAVACAESAPKLAPSGSIQAEWSGRVFSLTAQNECFCFDPQADAKPGIYRVEIPVFGASEAVEKSPPLFVASAEFELPRPDDAPVEVHLIGP